VDTDMDMDMARDMLMEDTSIMGMIMDMDMESKAMLLDTDRDILRKGDIETKGKKELIYCLKRFGKLISSRNK
jgi:hypothetical protein